MARPRTARTLILGSLLLLLVLATTSCFPRVNGVRLVPRVTQRAPSLVVTGPEGRPVSEPPSRGEDDTWYFYVRGAW